MTRTLVVIGPSASGKSTVVDALAGRGVLSVVPTWTTRPRRADEEDASINHRFVSDAEFDRMEADGAFLGSVTMFGLPHRYALPRLDLPPPFFGGSVPVTATPSPKNGQGDRRIVTVVARAQLLGALVPHLGAHVTYQIERPLRLAASTLICRSSSGCELHARLRDLAAERELGRAVADRVFCNDGPVDIVVDEVAAALRSDFAPHFEAIA